MSVADVGLDPSDYDLTLPGLEPYNPTSLPFFLVSLYK